MMIIGLLCVGMLGCEKARVEDDLGTFNDPKKALIETKKALVLLSNTLHKGYESASLLTEYEQTKNKIFNVKGDHKKSDLEKRK